MIERWNRDQVFEFHSFVVVTTAAALAIVAARHDYPVVHPRHMRTRPGKPEPRAHLTPASKVRSAHNAAAEKRLIEMRLVARLVAENGAKSVALALKKPQCLQFLVEVRRYE